MADCVCGGWEGGITAVLSTDYPLSLQGGKAGVNLTKVKIPAILQGLRGAVVTKDYCIIFYMNKHYVSGKYQL